jgi:hypothetical protein
LPRVFALNEVSCTSFLILHIFIIAMGNWLKFERRGTRLSIFAVIVSTILLISRQGFYEYGLNITSSFQQSHPSETIISIFNIFNILGNSSFIFGCLAAVHLLTSRKLLSIVFISYIALNVYVINVEKLFWQEPRPYSYDYRI